MHDRLPFARELLAASRVELLDAIASLTPAQWDWRPPTGGWTPGEILEHVAVIERGVVRMLLAGFPEGHPAVPRPPEKLLAYDRRLPSLLADRTARIEAPAALHPRRKYDTPEAVAALVTEFRTQAQAFADAPTWDLGTRTATHIVFGELDGVQWLILLAGHGSRHIAQIRSYADLPGWPA